MGSIGKDIISLILGMVKKYYLHAVIVKRCSLRLSRRYAYQFMKKQVGLTILLDDGYAFRHIAKGKFEPDSFRSKRVNSNIILIFGYLKDDAYDEGNGDGGGIPETTNNEDVL
jgi:hypothetical protein